MRLLKILANTLLFNILFWAQFSWAQNPPSLEEFSVSQNWLKALQYEKTLFGHKSRIDAPAFFLAEDGKTNPLAELKATLASFDDGKNYGKTNHPSHCIFTGRYHILRNVFQIKKRPPCPDFENWTKALNPKDISLIFASSYPNNPASIFGHTFLRINNQNNQGQSGSDLLDYGLNYAATTGSDGGIEFAVFGVFGMYEGHYSLMPYYLKINEYNNFENRDIFEYTLSFNKKQISLLLALVWEMENVGYSDYYFFDENCSFQILALLEGAAPEYDFIKDLPFYVSPIDTLKVLVEKNVAFYKKVRPSLRTQMFNYLETMNKKEKEQFENLILGKEINSSTLALEAAIHAMKLKKYSSMTKNDQMFEKNYRNILVRRAKINDSKIILKDNPIAAPHLAHKVKSLKIMTGTLNKELTTDLTFRLGWHDELNNDVGHIAFSKLDLLKLKITHSKNHTQLQNYYLVDVLSIEPSNHDFTPSWLWQLGGKRNDSEASSLAPFLKLGIGLSFENLEKNTRFFFLLNPELSYQKNYKSKLHTLLNPEIGLIHKSFINMKTSISYDYLMNNKEHTVRYPYFQAEFAKEINSFLELRSQVKTQIGSNFNLYQLGFNLLF